MSMMGTAVSGMLGDTNWLSSISQNVANANTTGYKDAETEFATVVDRSAPPPASAAASPPACARSTRRRATVVGTSDRHRPRGPGRRLFHRLQFVRRPLSDPQRLVRARQQRQSRQFRRLLLDGLKRPGRRSRRRQLAVRLDKVNVITAAELATPTTTGTLAMNLPSASTAVTTAADLPSANPSRRDATYTSETSLITYNNLGGAHRSTSTDQPRRNRRPADHGKSTAYNAADAARRRIPLRRPARVGDGDAEFQFEQRPARQRHGGTP